MSETEKVIVVVDPPQNRTLWQKLHRFYRGTLFQVTILGLISFTQPGIWSAMNGLGGGGQASPYLVNAANSITFGLTIVGAPLAGVVGNKVGLKWVLAFGTLGYAPYSAGLYANAVYGTEWLMTFGAATCGISAGALWTAEAAMAVGYPEPGKRGLYIAIWLAINKLGAVIAGAIQLALNADSSEKGSVSPKTYIVLIALQCCGLPLTLLISPPEKVIRSDGSKVVFSNKGRNWRSEFKALGSVFRRKEIILLLPIFVSAGWAQTYNGNFAAAYFSVRARTLMNFIGSVVGSVANLGAGGLLDLNRWRLSVRVRFSWVFLVFIYSAMFIWSILLQVRYSSYGPFFDWTTLGFSTGAGAYMFYRITAEVSIVWSYWILGIHDTRTDTLALTTGVLRACESLGSTVSYKVGSIENVSLLTNLLIAAGVFWSSVPPSTWASWLVSDIALGGNSGASDEEDHACVAREHDQPMRTVTED